MNKILIGTAAVVIVGGATYALVPRNVLKNFFEKSDKPTEQQFSNTIDSEVHLEDDKEPTGLKEYNPSKEYSVGDTAVHSQQVYQAKVETDSSASVSASSTGGTAPASTEEAGSAGPGR